MVSLTNIIYSIKHNIFLNLFKEKLTETHIFHMKYNKLIFQKLQKIAI